MWYDVRSRLTARLSSDPDGGGLLLPILERFDYDVFDNVVATELLNSWLDNGVLRVTALKSSYTYDAGNRLLSEMTQSPSVRWYFTSGLASQTSTLPGAVTISVANLEAYALANAPILNTPLSNSSNRGLVTTYNYFGTNNEVQVTQTNAGADPRVTKITLDRLDRITKSVSPAPLSGTYAVTGQQLEGGGLRYSL